MRQSKGLAELLEQIEINQLHAAGAVFRAQAFRQREIAEQHRYDGGTGGQVERRLVVDARCHAAQRRADDKADARSRPKNPKILAALLRRGYVGYVGRQDTEVAAGQPVDNAPQK